MANELIPTDPPPTAPDETPAEPESSLAEHEAQFGERSDHPADDPNPPAEEDARRPPRDRDDQGKFVKPEKHRAAKQEATKADVPRIQELTKRLRETEAERDALRSRTAPAPAAPPPAPPVPRGTSPQAAPPQQAVKPDVKQFQEYGDYVEALADWKIAEARRQDRAEATQRAQQAQQQAEETRIQTSWKERVSAASTRYPDFAQVALQSDVSDIPKDGLIDRWIWEHPAGADVLYSLKKDPAELRRVLALPLFEQVEALTLIGQRLSPSRAAAGRTGAAPTTPRAPAPRPPTPVRTGAMPAADEPPGDDASLADHERYYGPRRR